MQKPASRTMKGSLLVLPLALCTFALLSAVNHATASDRAGQTNPSQPDAPYWAASAVQARGEGHLAFADRASQIQGVMRKMYLNNGNYRSLSAIFVDHVPGDRPASIAFNISQPGSIELLAYGNSTASGSPLEEMVGSSTGDVFTNFTNHTTSLFPTPQTLAPSDIAQVPLSVIPRVSGATEIDSIMESRAAILADEAVHPGSLITSPMFTNKTVTVQSEGSFSGRPVWILQGTQVQGSPLLPGYGDRWVMFVDKETGIILRMEFYSGNSEIGWMALQDLLVNNAPGAEQWLQEHPVPAAVGFQQVDLGSYVNRANASK